ncbi:DUF4981 domain-containing protein [Streptomyces sp. SID2888]|nr:DUF4981 domain-containing protein [Streptomyces sp. SID2888]
MPGLQGGFIRGFRGHGRVRPVSYGRAAGRRGTGRYGGGVAALDRCRPDAGVLGDLPGHGAAPVAETVFPEHLPEPESAAPVGMECFRHEGIVIRNQRRRGGLDRLTAEWELTLADGRTLTAPAALPRLVPGESAAVPLPFALPRDGGEAWLTLRVRTAEDQPWAPKGTQVCVRRLRLRGPTARAAAVGSGAATA